MCSARLWFVLLTLLPMPSYLSLFVRVREKLEELLEDLVMERDAIGDAMAFCLEHADAAEEVRPLCT